MTEPVLVDLTPLSGPEQAVYRLWQQRLRKIHEEEGPLDFYLDGYPILIGVAMRFAARAGFNDEEARAIAHRVVDFEFNVYRLLHAEKGRPS